VGSRMTSGRSRGSRGAPRARRSRVIAGAAAALLAGLVAPGCYTFSGGGGFPSDVKTVYIAPFENRTDRFELEEQIFRKMTETLPRALGVRPGGEQVADAIVRGTITRYDDGAQAYVPGQQGQVQVLQHQVTIAVSVEIIDVKRNEILWESQSVTGRGEYSPDRQTDEAARTKAIDVLIQQIIDGAQSQW
jgi:hypothetical protein